jgi:molecular chaperone DnaK
MRSTIDYGIDLGTTNSAVAVLDGNDIQVIRNNENFEYTPSAVWIDKNGRLYAGRQAYEQLDRDPDNAHAEFKLQMGTSQPRTFARSGRQMKPEELSAEILKSLRADVLRRRDENPQSVVITVPAAFELPQCEATKVAAQLAGLTQTPLLQEPVAAALAYGFQSKHDKVFWLVYDFGGGTFDAAVVSIRDGVIQVVNHGGDNHLGGKLIDWAIVTELLVPALTKNRPLTDFRRGNPKWRGAFAKLKSEAEQAKIRVSNDDSAPIHIEFLCNDDRGAPVEFEYELRRADVEGLMEPLVLRSVNICKKVLADKRLAPGNIEKVLLVGGPTQAPYLRRRLADTSEGLGIALDFSVDPMTAVARGAAIFSGTQRVEGESQPVRAGEYAIELDYRPVGSDPEPVVGGRVFASAGPVQPGFSVEFINAGVRPPWRSGKVGLSPEGTFLAQLWAEKGRENLFDIELRDPAGNLQRVSPDRITYRVGLVISEQILIHSVGVALANNELAMFVEKGTALPNKARKILRTAVDVRKGQSGELIRVPVMEGENQGRADRNRQIGKLEVNGAQIRRDVPAGSEIEVVIEIDESRLVRTKAYIPILDEEFEEVLKLRMEHPKPAELKAEAEKEKKRLAEVRERARQTGDHGADAALQRVDGERMVHEVDGALAASQDDPDAADKCGKRLLDLKQAIDEAEDALEWPALVAEAEQEIKWADEVSQKYGKAGDKQAVATLEREIRETMKTHEPDLLRRKVDELGVARREILREQPGWWVGLFEDLRNNYRSKMRDSQQADALFNMAQRAIQTGDVPGLKSAVQQLIALLPQEQQSTVGSGSTVMLA